MTMSQALSIWLLMIPIAVANGTLRQFGYGPFMAARQAHQLSCLTAIIAFGAFFWIISRRWPFGSEAQALRVGVLWGALTVTFETVLGLQRGLSGEQIFADYAIWKGHLWASVVVFIVIAPWLIVQLEKGRGLQPSAKSGVRDNVSVSHPQPPHSPGASHD